MEKLDKTTNLLLNMSSGLLPENLTEEDVELLQKEYGVNWFEELGYTDKLYKRPTFHAQKENNDITRTIKTKI